MASLYNLTGDALKLRDLLLEGDIDEDIIRDAILNNQEEINIKLETYAKIIKEIESDINGLKAEELRLADRRKAMENNIARMKRNMQDALILSGQPKVKGQLFTFTMQKNPPSVVMDESYIENIPDKYLKHPEPTIDRKLLLEDLKAGVDLDGIAHLEQTESMRIR